MTALHWASDRGNLELVDFLVRAGANVNIQDYSGQTPLHYGYYFITKKGIRYSQLINPNKEKAGVPIRLRKRK